MIIRSCGNDWLPINSTETRQNAERYPICQDLHCMRPARQSIDTDWILDDIKVGGVELHPTVIDFSSGHLTNHHTPWKPDTHCKKSTIRHFHRHQLSRATNSPKWLPEDLKLTIKCSFK
jgi:hypothetical protein